MSQYYTQLAEQVNERFGERVCCHLAHGELTVELAADQLIDVCRTLRDEEPFNFEIMIDLCGVDYLNYGAGAVHAERFGVSYHLLSIKQNHRIRVRTYATGEVPTVDSVIDIWSGANWFEREAFDLYGIIFNGHPDLRRLLTDYGFIGHPFRKDFPMIGNVEMRYDPERKRVIYQPVSIENREQVPHEIRVDHRYLDLESGGEG